LLLESEKVGIGFGENAFCHAAQTSWQWGHDGLGVALGRPIIAMEPHRQPKCYRSMHVKIHILDPIRRYMLMMSYISPLATACCTVATPSLRLAFSV
jgi:hypothetical protein